MSKPLTLVRLNDEGMSLLRHIEVDLGQLFLLDAAERDLNGQLSQYFTAKSVATGGMIYLSRTEFEVEGADDE